MGRRAELSLGGLLFLAALATAILVWGQQTGKFKIFGDAFQVENTTTPLSLVTEAVGETTMSESFDSLRYFDPATTADWNIEADELTLPYGQTEGIARSLQVASVTGQTVSVNLLVDEDRPEGSAIYYAVSADDGATWQTISDLRAAVFTNPIGVWRWRAYLVRGVASRPPAIHELTLTFFAQQS